MKLILEIFCVETMYGYTWVDCFKAIIPTSISAYFINKVDFGLFLSIASIGVTLDFLGIQQSDL